MSLAGRSPELIFFLQILLDLLVIHLVFRLGLRLGGPAAGLIGSLLYAVHPLAMAYTARFSPVIPATLLFLYTALHLRLERGEKEKQGIGPFIGCGLLLGLGTLLIPLPFLALGLLALFFLWRRRGHGRIQKTAALVVGAAVLIMPALLHNSSLDGGRFTFAWTDGWAYSQASNPDTWGTPWSAVPPSWQDPEMISFDVGNDIRRTASWGDVERWYTTKGTQRFLETPLPSLILILKKALLTVNRVEIPDPVPMSGALEGWAPAFRWGLWLFPFLLGLFTIELVARIRLRSLPLLLLVPLLALVVDHILGPLSSSCRALALPWIATLAGLAIMRVAVAVAGGHSLRSLLLPVTAGVLVCAVSLGDFPGAGKKLLRKDETLRLLAQAREQGGQRPEAISILRRAARIAPEPNPWIYSDLGTYLAREPLYEQSIESFQRALSADSTHTASLLGMASVLRASGGSPKALGYLERLVSLYPNVPLYHNELGTLFMTLGDLPRARAELERAVVLDSDYGTALQNLRVLSQQEKQIEEFMVPPEMSISPSDPLHEISQQLVRALGRRDVAAVDSLAAVARDMRPDHILGDIMQGMVRVQTGSWETALPFLEASNDKAPGRAYLIRPLVSCYVELNRTEEAVSVLDQAIEDAADDNNRRLILDLRTTVLSRMKGS
jgi:tetratricopeptide (TPR) repeat protein